MQQLQANLYSIFLQAERDGPPSEADYLYEDDICRRELPSGSGRSICEALKPDRLHVAQYLAYHRIQWFDGTEGKMLFSKRGRPRMCKCNEGATGNGAEMTKPQMW
jgi:hypothetical protein